MCIVTVSTKSIISFIWLFDNNCWLLTIEENVWNIQKVFQLVNCFAFYECTLAKTMRLLPKRPYPRGLVSVSLDDSFVFNFPPAFPVACYDRVKVRKFEQNARKEDRKSNVFFPRNTSLPDNFRCSDKSSWLTEQKQINDKLIPSDTNETKK